MTSYHIILIISTVLLALNSATLGSYLVLNKMSMLIDAIAHAILPAIVLSFVFFNFENNLFSLILSCVLGVVIVVVIHLLSLNKNTRKDAVIGVTYTFLFALGILFLSLNFKNSPFELESILFGELNYLPYQKGWWINNVKIPYILLVLVLFTLLILFFIIKFKKIWIVLSFDAQFAKTLGLNTVLWNVVMLSLITVNTVVNFQSVGAIMVISLTVMPPAFALICTKKINIFMWITLVFTLLSVLLGYVIAWFLNLNIVATIAVFMGVLLLLTLVIKSYLKIS